MAISVTDEITYHLPDGISSGRRARRMQTVSWPGHAMFVPESKIESRPDPDRRLAGEAFTLAKPEEYQDLRGFYQKVAAADQEELVLTASPGGAPAQAGKGN